MGGIDIHPTDIKDSNYGNSYYVIVQANNVEKLLTNEAKDEFSRYGFEIVPPIEYNAMRSVVIKHLDKVINEYTDNEIIASINAKNPWAEVDSIYKITLSGRLLKVRFQSTTMVKKALEEGMIVLHQFIPPRQIEREVYVK